MCNDHVDPEGVTSLTYQKRDHFSCMVTRWVLRLFSHVWLCDRMDCSLLSSSICGIIQARILEWVAVPFSRGSSWHRDLTHTSCSSCVSGSLPLSHQGSPSSIIHQHKCNDSQGTLIILLLEPMHSICFCLKHKSSELIACGVGVGKIRGQLIFTLCGLLINIALFH